LKLGLIQFIVQRNGIYKERDQSDLVSFLSIIIAIFIMVFPTVSYSTKLTLKKSTSPSASTTSNPATTKKPRLGQSKIGPRSAPDRYDRIAAYDRAFQKYIQKDSKLASWKQKMDEKGLPNPLIEGTVKEKGIRQKVGV
jgi:hypothetical protein